MVVKQFVSRRDTRAAICSDDVIKFIGAEKELCECFESWNRINIAAEIANKIIKWWFNWPGTPHLGDIGEKKVSSFKRILYAICGTRGLTDEVLNTTSCLV